MEFSTIIILLASYVVGGVVFYALDGWFDWQCEDLAMSAMFWPVSIWFVLADRLRRFASELKARREEIKAEERRVRVAAERQARLEMEAVERELEAEYRRAARK